jgi:DNA-binding LytR/AlgR family response regulator
MILNCVVIDDEPLAISIIEEHIVRTPFLSLVAKFTNAVRAFEYLSENRTDLIFIDIQMPDLTGIDLVQRLEHKPVVIFTTAFDRYALEGFRADAVDYLLKPVDYPDFLKAAEKAKKWLGAGMKAGVTEGQVNIFIKTGNKILRIETASVKYIEGMSEYVRIHRDNGKPVMALMSLKSLEDQLPGDHFIRVHRSFIVNSSKISEIENNTIVCNDGFLIPVSRSYREELQDHIKKHSLG